MNILFDIDNTLFPSSEFSSLARKNAINAMISMGLEGNYDDLRARLVSIIKEKGPNYHFHFTDLCKEVGADNPGKYIAAAVVAYHDTKASVAPYPTVLRTLLRLKEEGHSLFIATNGASVKQWDKLIRLGLAIYFDKVFVSEDLGMEKSPEFFQKVLEMLGAEPKDCIMVGDRNDADIAPAKEVGLVTVKVLRDKNADIPSVADYKIEDISELLPIMKNL
jgi:putative hydrolase of the HAD superfamily